MNTTVNIIVILATLMLIIAPMIGTKTASDVGRGTVTDILVVGVWGYALGASIYTAILVISGLTW